MRLWTDPAITTLIAIVRDELLGDQAVYLVGGAVRDLILRRPLHDLDFVMAERPIRVAKRVARRLDAGFFVLDDERHTARVVHTLPDGQTFPLDFVQFTGSHLETDLRNRDFTLNAMAIDLAEPERVIDPLGGQADLEAGILQTCSDRALLDDPVRVLRAVRQAHQFGFNYAPGLMAQMREAAKLLPQTAVERQRDEFFKILEGPNPAAGVHDCWEAGILAVMLSPLMAQADIPASPPHHYPLLEHTFKAVAVYQKILEGVVSPLSPPRAGEMDSIPWWLAAVKEALGAFSNEAGAYLTGAVTPGRTVWGLALLGALLHDVAKPATLSEGEDGRLHFYGHDKAGSEMAWDLARGLQLSNAEAEWAQTFVRYHMRLLPMVRKGHEPTRKRIYHFYRNTGRTGVAIALFSLADTVATYGPDLSKAHWETSLMVVRALLAAWWDEQDSVIAPKPLLNGNDLKREFELRPGKQLGELLAALVEAQAAGEVRTIEEARAFIARELEKSD
jgi:tRNA nucleotidyltransferase/poly(A) polymerase